MTKAMVHYIRLIGDTIAHLWHRLPAVQGLCYFVIAYIGISLNPSTVTLYGMLWMGFVLLLVSHLAGGIRWHLPIHLTQGSFRLGLAVCLIAIIALRLSLGGGDWCPFDLTSIATSIQHKVVEAGGNIQLSEDTRRLVQAIALGYMPWTEGVRSMREMFIQSGVAHILAVSGFHLGIVVLCLSRLLGLVPHLGRSLRGRTAILLLGAWAFTILTGCAIPTIRASLMLSMYLVGRLLGRPISVTNILTSAALLQLLVAPSLLTNAGFLLSHIAVLSIHLFYKPIYTLVGDLKQPVLAALWSMLSLSLSAQIMVLPLCLWLFGSVSWAFVWTTIPITLLSSIIIPLALTAYLLCLVGIYPYGIDKVIEWLSEAMLQVAEMGSSLRLLEQEMILPLWAVVILWGIALSLACYLKRVPSP